MPYHCAAVIAQIAAKMVPIQDFMESEQPFVGGAQKQPKHLAPLALFSKGPVSEAYHTNPPCQVAMSMGWLDILLCNVVTPYLVLK